MSCSFFLLYLCSFVKLADIPGIGVFWFGLEIFKDLVVVHLLRLSFLQGDKKTSCVNVRNGSASKP